MIIPCKVINRLITTFKNGIITRSLSEVGIDVYSIDIISIRTHFFVGTKTPS